MILFPLWFFISWILYLLGMFGVGPINLYFSWDVSCQPPGTPGYWGKLISISNFLRIIGRKCMYCHFVYRCMTEFLFCLRVDTLVWVHLHACICVCRCSLWIIRDYGLIIIFMFYIAACYFNTSSGASVHIHQLWLWQATTRIPQNKWEVFDLGKSSIEGPKPLHDLTVFTNFFLSLYLIFYLLNACR